MCLVLKNSQDRNKVFGALNGLRLTDQTVLARANAVGNTVTDIRARQDAVRESLFLAGILQSTIVHSTIANRQRSAFRESGSVVFSGVIGVHNPYNKPIAAFTYVVWDVPDPKSKGPTADDNPTRENAFFGLRSFRPFIRPYDATIPTDSQYLIGRCVRRFDPNTADGMMELQLGL
jgi:hypothetical protein